MSVRRSTIALNGVIKGEEINLTVNVSGGSASVQSVVRQNPEKIATTSATQFDY